jgi:predicted ATP-binding protein involved in virulence
MKRVSNIKYEKENVHSHYFLQLSVENLRCFGKRQTIRFSDENGNPFHWTIIMGDNGVGKTSLLKSIVSLAPSPKNMFGSYQDIRLYPGIMDWHDQWNPQRHLGDKPTRMSAEIISAHGLNKLIKGNAQTLTIEKGHKKFNDMKVSDEAYAGLGDFLCFAYGASRKMGKVNLSGGKYSTASISLFDDDAPLINVEEFFLQADYDAKTAKSKKSISEREHIKKLLVDILPEVDDIRISKEKDRSRSVEMRTKFGWVRIGEMSLGYKSLIAWVVDFASRMFYYHRTKPDPFAQPAVVLIDEIDLHLHPKWQRKILTYLSKKFPNTQFIASAHSPLIVQAALDANLVLLKRSGDQVVINNNPEIIKNWRIDQILTSDLFGLSSARSESTEKLLNTRRKLLVKKKLTASDKKKISSLEEQMGYMPVAETPEYIKAMQLIEKASSKLN